MLNTSVILVRNSVWGKVQQVLRLGILVAVPVFAANAATSISIPLFFEENRGQTDPSVLFINRSADSTVFFRQEGVVLSLPPAADSRAAVVQMQFLNADSSVTLSGSDELPGKSAYFRGSDPERWVRNAAQFSSITYNDVYPGIDVVFQGHEGELRYDFHVAPNTDPDQIRLAFTGIDGARLAENGDLVLDTPAQELVHRAPVVYQEIDDKKIFIHGQFVIGDQKEVSFALADYDQSRPLVIDPVISYSTFLGGTGFDNGRAIRVDPSDRTIVVMGTTDSLDFPLVNPIQAVHSGGIYPLGWAPNPNGTNATYLWDKSFGRTDTYSVSITASARPAGTLNNPGWRTVDGIPINQTSTYTASVWVNSPDGGVGHIPAIQFFDANDNFLVTIGATGPSGFPPQAHGTWIQRQFTFTPSNYAGLVTATHVRVILVQDIELTQGSATTVYFDDVELIDNASPGINLIGPSSSFIGQDDVFVSRLSADGSTLLFATYLGGTARETPQNLELDSAGNIIFGGRTSSADYPTANADQPVFAGPWEDAFLTKIAADGSSLIFSTFVGGNDNYFPVEEIRGIVVDSGDNIFVSGNTGASNFVVTDIISAACVAAAQPRSSDIFIREYSPTGTLLFSTCFGGSSRDAGRNLAFDSSGNLFLNGWTESIDFPTTPGVVQPTFAGDSSNLFAPVDGWVAKVNINTSPPAILAATYLGGDGFDYLEGLAVDSFDNVLVSGTSAASDYPTTLGAYQETYGGDDGPGTLAGDGVITKLSTDLTSFGFSTFLGGSGSDFAWGLKLDVEDRPYVTGYTNSPNFPVADPIQGALGGPQDAFVSQLTAAGDGLDFSSYLGGSGSEGASNGITVLNPGNVFLTGGTGSTDYPLVDPFQGTLGGTYDAYVTNISTPITVPADDCTDADGCNPTGGQQIILPEGYFAPPGATITQTAESTEDPRVDEFGRCDGTTPLSLYDGDLVIPGYLCGGEDGFTVLITETTGIDIREGTVLSIGFPEVFSADALECERPIVGSRQLQDVMVWQTTDKSDLYEGHAIEVTHDCGTSRSKTRGLSYFVVGMFIEFGLGPNPLPDVETQAFRNLLVQKAEALVAATEAAELVLKNGDLVKLSVKARDILGRLESGEYVEALNKIDIFLDFVDKAVFDTSVPFNHEGNMIMRAGNIKFILEVKVIPFTS